MALPSLDGRSELTYPRRISTPPDRTGGDPATGPQVDPSALTRRRGTAQHLDVTMISGQTDLALRTLRALSGSAAGVTVGRLAVTLETTPDRLLELMAPLTYAGWVERYTAKPDAFRYTRPRPAPTVHDVADAVEGAGAIDDCVLRPGVACAALASAAVCVDHHAWQRQLNASALVAVPLTAAVRARSWREANPRGAGPRQSRPSPSAPLEAAGDGAPGSARDGNVPSESAGLHGGAAGPGGSAGAAGTAGTGVAVGPVATGGAP